MHFAENYIGLPWVAGGRGAREFDCWGLVLWVQKHYYGREVSLIPVDPHNYYELIHAFSHHPERKRWDLVDNPSDGDVVLMKRHHYPIHAGIWIDVDGGGVLHALEGVGVVFQKTIDLALHGLQIEGFYCYAGG